MEGHWPGRSVHEVAEIYTAQDFSKFRGLTGPVRWTGLNVRLWTCRGGRAHSIEPRRQKIGSDADRDYRKGSQVTSNRSSRGRRIVKRGPTTFPLLWLPRPDRCLSVSGYERPLIPEGGDHHRSRDSAGRWIEPRADIRAPQPPQVKL